MLRAYSAPGQGAASLPASAVAHFQAGQRASKAGNFNRAVEEYKQVLRFDPTIIEAQVNLGLAYHALGQYRLAAAELEKVLHERPNLLGANLFLGIDYFKLGLFDKAVPPLEAALRIEASNREARRALATCYVDLDRYGQAAEEFQTLSSLETDKAENLYALGQGYMDLVKRLASRMAQQFQNSGWADRLAGDLVATRRQWTDAAVSYRQALAVDPSQPGLHASLGRMDLPQGKLLKAEEEFQSELGRDPGDEQALLGLAEVQLARGLPGAALESISAIWEAYPPFLGQQGGFPSIELGSTAALRLASELGAFTETPAKHFLLSRLYSVAGQGDKARDLQAAFEKELSAWREKPAREGETAAQLCRSHQYRACARRLQFAKRNDASSRLQLGRALLSLGEIRPAADQFAAALGSANENPEAIYWLSKAYVKLAEACFQQLIEELPKSWRAYQFRGKSDQLRYAYDDAVEEYQMAIHLRPDNVELHEALGRLYFFRKSYGRAEEELKKAIELDPSRTASLDLLGRVYFAQHEARESIPYLQGALRWNPALLAARAALGQAYMRIGEVDRAIPELEKSASIDTYGDLHYLLYEAYRKQGKNDLAQQALALSQELRKRSAAIHQARIAQAVEEENQP